jgi:hypothetical protein
MLQSAGQNKIADGFPFKTRGKGYQLLGPAFHTEVDPFGFGVL